MKKTKDSINKFADASIAGLSAITGGGGGKKCTRKSRSNTKSASKSKKSGSKGGCTWLGGEIV